MEARRGEFGECTHSVEVETAASDSDGAGKPILKHAPADHNFAARDGQGWPPIGTSGKAAAAARLNYIA